MAESFPNTTIDIVGKGKSTNRIGKLEYQRFTRIIKGEHIPCIGMRQYFRLGVVDASVVLSSVDDTRILSWYCTAPLTKLTDETLERFLQDIRIRGLRLTERRQKQNMRG
jgi:hypothetical protein